MKNLFFNLRFGEIFIQAIKLNWEAERSMGKAYSKYRLDVIPEWEESGNTDEMLTDKLLKLQSSKRSAGEKLINEAYGAFFETTKPLSYHTFTVSRFPREVDLAKTIADFPDSQDQHSIGACTAFSVAFALEVDSRSKNKNPVWNLDPFFLYREMMVYAGDGKTIEDLGGTIRQALETANRVGVASRHIFEPIGESKWNHEPTPADRKTALLHRNFSFSAIRQSTNQIRAAILSGHAVIFSFAISREINAWMKDPVVQNPTYILPTPWGARDLKRVIGAHAVLITGYNDSNELFTIQNSWGPLWGVNGRFFMTYNHVFLPFWSRDFYVVL